MVALSHCRPDMDRDLRGRFATAAWVVELQTFVGIASLTVLLFLWTPGTPWPSPAVWQLESWGASGGPFCKLLHHASSAEPGCAMRFKGRQSMAEPGKAL